MSELVSMRTGADIAQGAGTDVLDGLFDSNAVRQELFEIRALLSLN